MQTFMNRRAFLTLSVAAAAAVALPTAAFAITAEAYVTTIGDAVVALANGSSRGKALRGKFAALLSQHVNLRNIAASSLGQFRSKLPKGDAEKFNTLVTTYAAATFVWYVDKFKGSDFVVDSAVKQGNFVVVKSRIVKGGGGGEPVVWYLSPKGAGFQVVDMSILGVRLSVAMRDAFSRELRKSKGDFEALYSFLREAETW